MMTIVLKQDPAMSADVANNTGNQVKRTPTELAASATPLVEGLLRLGDNALVLSQRLSAWCGHGPAIEEDMALTNVALDLLGQSRMWLTLAGSIEGAGRDEDALAYLRDANQFRNVLLTELPDEDYARTIVRQFFFDVWHYFLLERLTHSTNPDISAIAAKSLKEVTYHVRRASDMIVRLGDGTAESHQRMQDAVDALWPYTGELFVDDAIELVWEKEGWGPKVSSLQSVWSEHVGQVMAEATLTLPAAEAAMHAAFRGGRTGRHTEHLGFLLAEMQFLQRAYPGASW
jgi:ring-1,2-phenylacetyl-CoA epoxidase subunit PaaC